MQTILGRARVSKLPLQMWHREKWSQKCKCHSSNTHSERNLPKRVRKIAATLAALALPQNPVFSATREAT